MIYLTDKDNQIIKYAGLVYIIVDTPGNNKANIKYIGKTTNPLDVRLNQHINSTKSNLGIAIRINRDAIKNWKVIQFYVKDKNLLARVEQNLIRQLGAEFNTLGIRQNSIHQHPIKIETIDDMNIELKRIEEQYKIQPQVFLLTDKLPQKRGLNTVTKRNLINRINAAINELLLIKAELETIDAGYTIFQKDNGDAIWIPKSLDLKS